MDKEITSEVRAAKLNLLALMSMKENIEFLLQGKEVDDFSLSFPLVREVQDLLWEITRIEKFIKEREESTDGN